MKVDKIIIDGIAGLTHLELFFNNGVNVICGANGIGKSTILDVIADAFSVGTPSKLKRNAKFTQGQYQIYISNGEDTDSQTTIVSEFLPDNQSYRGMWTKYSNELLCFGINRSIDYEKLFAVSSDPSRESHIVGGMAINGINIKDMKNWFVNRYLFFDKKGSLTQEQIYNYSIATQALSFLDKNVSFKTISAQTYDIILETSKGDIYFEYLSSGYKSCFFVILGMIKEIDFRHVDSPIRICDFDGIVLIDEIDLHLHPVWQAKLVAVLKKVFPKAQFILTTHSPSVLQALESTEIIALGSDDVGNTMLKELHLGEYGLQGWTLEEILRDIMELPETTSKLYQETIDKFDKALENENGEEVMHQYELLKKMLHPNNPLRKLLSIQVAQWEE